MLIMGADYHPSFQQMSFWCGRGELNPHGLSATGS